jgi:Flp pilus assembly pilin Flp
MKNLIARFVRDDQGQDLIEYAILIGLITVGTVAIVKYIGTWTKGQFSSLSTDLSTAS